MKLVELNCTVLLELFFVKLNFLFRPFLRAVVDRLVLAVDVLDAVANEVAVSLLFASDDDDSPLLLLLFEFSLLLAMLMLIRLKCDDFVLFRVLLLLLLELLEL